MPKLRELQTAVLMEHETINGDFTSDPYEAGWALEAMAFVYVKSAPKTIENQEYPPSLNLRVQLSADGRRWVEDGTRLQPLTQPGSYLLRVSHFGNWLRIVGTTERIPSGEFFLIDIYWVFKA
jgi:hypothetical protein